LPKPSKGRLGNARPSRRHTSRPSRMLIFGRGRSLPERRGPQRVWSS
jgi:hypothetical protein